MVKRYPPERESNGKGEEILEDLFCPSELSFPTAINEAIKSAESVLGISDDIRSGIATIRSNKTAPSIGSRQMPACLLLLRYRHTQFDETRRVGRGRRSTGFT